MIVLYLVGSFAGIALLVLLNLALFGRARPAVGTAEQLAAHLAREIPGFRAGRFALDRDGRAALVENVADRSIVLVDALGDGLVTRRLGGAVLSQVQREEARLSLTLRDFTLPRVALGLESDAVARDWEHLLKA